MHPPPPPFPLPHLPTFPLRLSPRSWPSCSRYRRPRPSPPSRSPLPRARSWTPKFSSAGSPRRASSAATRSKCPATLPAAAEFSTSTRTPTPTRSASSSSATKFRPSGSSTPARSARRIRSGASRSRRSGSTRRLALVALNAKALLVRMKRRRRASSPCCRRRQSSLSSSPARCRNWAGPICAGSANASASSPSTPCSAARTTSRNCICTASPECCRTRSAST